MIKTIMLRKATDYLKSFKIPFWGYNISKVYIGDILSKVLAVGTLILIIRGLNVADYTAYTVFYTISVLVPSLVGNGINLTLVLYVSERLSISKEKPLEFYIASFLIQIVLYLCLCLILLVTGNSVNSLLFGEKNFCSVFNLGLVAGFGILVSQAGRSIYQAEERFTAYIKTLWLRQIFPFLATLALFAFGYLTLRYILYSTIIGEMMVGAIILWHIFHNISIQQFVSILRDELHIITDFLFLSKWLIAYAISVVVFDRLNIFMLSHLSTEYELANFGVAYRYFSLAMLLLGSVHTVLLPMLSKVEMQNAYSQKNFAAKWLKTTGWLIIPIIAILLILKSAFIWVNGEQYHEAFYSLFVLSFCFWIGLICSPLVSIIVIRRETKLLFVLGIIALIFSLVGNYYLIPAWGALGAAVAMVISHAIINLTCGVRVFLSK